MRLVMLSAMLVLSCTVAQSAGPINITVGETVLEVQEGGSPVLQYKYRDVPFKPYALSWYTPKGVNILRDAPEDHKHHHGLMYAINWATSISGRKRMWRAGNCIAPSRMSGWSPNGPGLRKWPPGSVPKAATFCCWKSAA